MSTPILRWNGLFLEIERRFLNEVARESELEVQECIHHATGFGRATEFVNFSKVLELFRSYCGRKKARELDMAVSGPPEQLPLLALSTSKLVATIARQRLQNSRPAHRKRQVFQEEHRAVQRTRA